MFEQVIRFIYDHNLSVIQWLIFGTAALGLATLGFIVFGKLGKSEGAGDAGDGASVDQDELTRKLREALQSVGGEGLGLSLGSGLGAVGVTPAQIASFQSELESKRKENEDLKTKLEAAQNSSGGESSGEVSSLLKKIQDLEGRLAEYEILEDDIADLSLFKEENARLRAEIAELRKGGPVDGTQATPASAVQIPVTESVSPAPGASAIVDEFKAALGAENADAGQVPGAIAPDAAEMAQADSDQLSGGTPAAPVDASEAQSKIQAEDKPAVEAPKAESISSVESDDLLSEFAMELGVSEDESSEVDADKMLAEVAGLESVASMDGLEAEADIDKMAAEAANLLKG